MCLVSLAAVAVAACNTRDPYSDSWWAGRPEPGASITPRVQASPYMLAMFEGTSGRPLVWTDLWEGMQWADIVIVGEQHDDANAHQVQTTLVAEMMAAWPGSALSMEMLERNEQVLVDAYCAGALTTDEFIDQTGSRNWAGKGSWVRFYQPMIDAARDGGGRVIAANAPRQFVRSARTDGYDALTALPPEDRAHFDLPLQPPPHTYRERFRAFMTDDDGGPTEVELDTMLRAQRLWDSTMAASIVAAYQQLPKYGKVIHVVGQFHSEFDGGLVSEIQARTGSARILTITVQKGEANALRAEDKGKADVVVYGVAPVPVWTAAHARRTMPPAERSVPGDATDDLPAVLPEWGIAY